MSASYDEESEADLDWIRAVLGDTDVEDEDNALHTDERIAFVLDQWPGRRGMALAQLAQELVTRLAQEPVRVTVTGIAVDYSERIKAWSNIAAPYVTWLQKQTASASNGGDITVPPFRMFGVARGRRGQ